MHDIGYCCEVFGQAVRILATSALPMEERLTAAFTEAIHAYGGESVEGLSVELQNRMLEFKDAMTQAGRPAVTVGVMTRDRQEEMAAELLDIQYALRSERQDPPAR